MIREMGDMQAIVYSLTLLTEDILDLLVDQLSTPMKAIVNL